jgi:hypothetical protein
MTSKNAEIAVLQTQMVDQKLTLDELRKSANENFQAVNKKLDENQTEMDARLRRIETILVEAKGGWKMLMLIGGLAAGVGALVGKFAGLFLTVPK